MAYSCMVMDMHLLNVTSNNVNDPRNEPVEERGVFHLMRVAASGAGRSPGGVSS